MKKEKNELLVFLAGVVLLVVGLFLFCQKVEVASTWGLGWRVGGFPIGGGLVIVPLIIGIVWMFATGSMASKVFSGFSVLLIIAAVIASTRIYLRALTLFDWILILVLIFAGVGLILRTTLAGKNKKDSNSGNANKEGSHNSSMDIDEEIEKIKNNK